VSETALFNNFNQKQLVVVVQTQTEFQQNSLLPAAGRVVEDNHRVTVEYDTGVD
jgi:hypothetical protein